MVGMCYYFQLLDMVGGSCEFSVQIGLELLLLLISASQVARITGVSHQCLTSASA
jgi:hypothetical protein